MINQDLYEQLYDFLYSVLNDRGLIEKKSRFLYRNEDRAELALNEKFHLLILIRPDRPGDRLPRLTLMVHQGRIRKYAEDIWVKEAEITLPSDLHRIFDPECYSVYLEFLCARMKEQIDS